MLAELAKRINYTAKQTIIEYRNRKTTGMGKDPHYRAPIKDPAS